MVEVGAGAFQAFPLQDVLNSNKEIAELGDLFPEGLWMTAQFLFSSQDCTLHGPTQKKAEVLQVVQDLESKTYKGLLLSAAEVEEVYKLIGQEPAEGGEQKYAIALYDLSSGVVRQGKYPIKIVQKELDEDQEHVLSRLGLRLHLTSARLH